MIKEKNDDLHIFNIIKYDVLLLVEQPLHELRLKQPDLVDVFSS